MAENRTTSRELIVDVDGRTESSRQARLQGALRDAVRSGRLAAGSRLPSSRALAADLGVSRGVVVEAYDQLIAEGYLHSRQGSGTVVADGAARPANDASSPQIAPPTAAWRVDFEPGRPDLDGFPRSMWTSAIRSALAELTAADLDYGDPLGDPVLRAELAAYLGRVRGAAVEPERVHVVGGVGQGLGLLARTRRAAGDTTVFVEDPGAYVLRGVVETAGLPVEPVPVDHAGMIVDRLPATGERQTVLVSPAHQYPMGAVLAPERRAVLVDWARSGIGRLVVEDDYDAEFRYDRSPIGCIQGLAPEHVALTGSVSKSLAPGLRIGWLVLPERWSGPVGERQLWEHLQPPIVDQRAFAHLLASGRYDRHIRRARARSRERRDVLLEQLGRIADVEIHGVSAGLQVVATLPVETDVAAITAATAEARVQVRSLDDYRVRPAEPPGVVLAFAHLTVDEIRVGVAVVAEAIARQLG
ncbi:MAG: PLP-dependent aminotransferase family protein [Actinomycetota bacterium]